MVRPLVRGGAPHQQTRNCLTLTKIWSWAPDGVLTQGQTGFDFELQSVTVAESTSQCVVSDG
jgi:hypothetical protein